MKLVEGQRYTADHIIQSHRSPRRVDKKRKNGWLAGSDKESSAAASAGAQNGHILARALKLFCAQIDILS
jgi:hypothetical protein